MCGYSDSYYQRGLRPKSRETKSWNHWTGKEKFPDEHEQPNFEKMCEVWAG